MMTEIVLRTDRGFACWPFYVLPRWVMGTEREEAYRLHEQAHCRRQAWQTPLWWARYALSKSFRWREERIAYRVEIQHMERPSPTYYATALSEEYWGMVDYQSALAWVRSVIRSKPQGG